MSSTPPRRREQSEGCLETEEHNKHEEGNQTAAMSKSHFEGRF